MELLIFLGAVIVLGVNLVIASKFSAVAEMKGHDNTGTVLAMCFFLGIVGYLYVIALPDKNLYPKNETVNEDVAQISTTRHTAHSTLKTETAPIFGCPTCKKPVKQGECICPNCGEEIDWS